MSFADMMLWLISAMGVTAVVFLLWTFAAVIRANRSGLGSGGERPLSSLAPQDPGGPA